MTLTSIARKPTETRTAPSLSDISPRAVRENADLSQDQMASLLGMSASGYTQWEQGSRRPGGPAYRLLHLIDSIGKPVIDDLLAVAD